MRDPGVHWQTKTAASTLLLPLSWLYCLLVGVRRLAYRSGVLRTQHLPVPVIVVGNLTVGGTGKTPLVIWLADLLRAHGWLPGIVTRGYGGRQTHWPIQVTPDSDPVQVGDEPVLLARRSGCPVVAGPNRVADARMLLRDHGCDLVISDDGLQHYALKRDIDIAVVDGVRRYGNERCLPAGPLREPLSSLRRVQVRVAHGQPLEGEIGMQLEADALYNLRTEQTLAVNTIGMHGPIHAVAGIGHPARFFQQLRRLGAQVIIEHAYADHHPYSAADITFPDKAMVIMTEKDAVKCRPYAQAQHWYLAVSARPEPRLASIILNLLEEKRHGQKTA